MWYQGCMYAKDMPKFQYFQYYHSAPMLYFLGLDLMFSGLNMLENTQVTLALLRIFMTEHAVLRGACGVKDI